MSSENKIDININNDTTNQNQIIPNEEKEKKPEEQIPEEKGQPISGMVDQVMVAQLMSMGYSKNVSEKSLFLNKNNFDNAMEWIYINQSEKDFEEELTIVQGGKPKSNLTEEEQYAKAKELQERARKMMKEREKENERLAAIKRIEESKENKKLLNIIYFILF